jgi:hypothetical protein
MERGEMDRIYRMQDYRMDGGGVVGALKSQGMCGRCCDGWSGSEWGERT